MVEAALSIISTAFPEAIEVYHPSAITQRGLFLFFNGMQPKEQIGGTASFMLFVAESSLSKQTSSAAVKVDTVIKKTTELILEEGDKWSFGGVKPAIFEGSTLFMYAVEMRIEV